MKHALTALAAVSSLTMAAPAFAQAWMPIEARQAMLERRIDRGLDDGSLTRREAMRLRAEFRDIERLEDRYRSTRGLQGWERADLDRRFDRLSQQIRFERRDDQGRDRDRDFGRDRDRDFGRDAGVYRR